MRFSSDGYSASCDVTPFHDFRERASEYVPYVLSERRDVEILMYRCFEHVSQSEWRAPCFRKPVIVLLRFVVVILMTRLAAISIHSFVHSIFRRSRRRWLYCWGWNQNFRMNRQRLHRSSRWKRRKAPVTTVRNKWHWDKVCSIKLSKCFKNMVRRR